MCVDGRTFQVQEICKIKVLKSLKIFPNIKLFCTVISTSKQFHSVLVAAVTHLRLEKLPMCFQIPHLVSTAETPFINIIKHTKILVYFND